MHLARVYFASNEKTGFIHPAGDGERVVVLLESPGRVLAFYPPILDKAVFTEKEWASFRAEPMPIDDPAALARRIEAKREEMIRQGVAFDRETTETILGLLAAMTAPPPRVRVRSIAKQPTSPQTPLVSPEGPGNPGAVGEVQTNG